VEVLPILPRIGPELASTLYRTARSDPGVQRDLKGVSRDREVHPSVVGRYAEYKPW